MADANNPLRKLTPIKLSTTRGASGHSLSSMMPSTHGPRHRLVKLDKLQDPEPCSLPHVTNLTDVTYIGGIYDKEIYRSNWNIDPAKEGPYLRYLKSISKGWPHIAWLADFMEVGTSPLKWKALPVGDAPGGTDERAVRTKIAVLEFPETGGRPSQRDIENSDELLQQLNENDLSEDPEYVRLIIVEDVSRTVIEALGAKYDIDPMYFRSHISDYLWYKPSDPWVELDDLPHVARDRDYFNIRYMRPRYFESEKVIVEAKGQLGNFNVLRRLEEDLSWKVRELKKPVGPTVGLLRSKAALWIRRNKASEKGVIGILIVDPTLKAGYPLWEGPQNLKPCPSMYAASEHDEDPRETLFDDVCHYARSMPEEEVRSINEQPRTLGLAITSIIAAEWVTVVKYIISGLTDIEWKLERPEYREALTLEDLLDRLHPLRRLIPVYRMMISETLSTILDPLKLTGHDTSSRHLQKLRSDFESSLVSIEQLHARTQNIISFVTTIIGVEENQRAMKMNKNLMRVTYLAVIFAPMAFVSSFFSMAPDIAALEHTFWRYFAVAIPITLICLAVADYRILLKQFKKLTGKKFYANVSGNLKEGPEPRPRARRDFGSKFPDV